MTAQETMMRGIAKTLREWARELGEHPTPTSLTRGRLEGLALGIEAIAELARLDPPEEGKDA
ncbi:hypothetical protein KTR66_04495 [Roseococcus sp. SDR]|uniref:hypothetical protein n=1 Tax=Roseococcus sp. SDR TaxID=2835532 RepID=UPI001BD0C2FF|nr:hypothetical protein [Roseococcus sp. SDR]MBS7789238.1 hypothetical protein [Roseococcus sp. SDR]MBV1844552.1 hypothetical protein [Roseococcus sp. SDR]